ncbi:hypothetical protein T11_16724, partial [Trichinella zimbabwensis]
SSDSQSGRYRPLGGGGKLQGGTGKQSCTSGRLKTVTRISKRAVTNVPDLCKSKSNEKPSRLFEHLRKVHDDKAKKDLSYFQSLRNKFRARKSLSNMCLSAAQQKSDEMRASYSISLLIAKTIKLHTIDKELIFSC